MSEPDVAETPFLRIEAGEPTPEELAAVVAVLAARRGGTAPNTLDVARSAWSAPARSHRGIHAPGPGAWRGSAWPR